jgi:hypothetical protein
MSEIKINEFIYAYENVIDEFLCKKIIKLFDNEPFKNKGIVKNGFLPEIKNTTDIVLCNNTISKSVFNKEWIKIVDVLTKQINKYVSKYIETLEKTDNILFKTSVGEFIEFDAFMIQKYTKNEGKYEYHNDHQYDMDRSRLITYIFYLNSIESGGETEFNGGKTIIKPESGKLVLFPATWTYPHCGKIPITEDKYIITGWIYTSCNHYVLNKLKQTLEYSKFNT